MLLKRLKYLYNNYLYIELMVLKFKIIRSWKMDTTIKTVGTIALILGIGLLILFIESIAKIYRSVMPLVAGCRIGEVYWRSMQFAFEVAFVSLIFGGALLLFILLKGSKRI